MARTLASGGGGGKLAFSALPGACRCSIEDNTPNRNFLSARVLAGIYGVEDLLLDQLAIGHVVEADLIKGIRCGIRLPEGSKVSLTKGIPFLLSR